MSRAYLSSERLDWNTPKEILSLIRRVAPIGLDPCSNAGSIVEAQTSFDLARGEDGLKQSWQGCGLVFCNPPYGLTGLRRWASKIVKEAELGVEIIALLPARPGSAWWSKLCSAQPTICLLRGRLTFLGAPSPAPFPSVLFYFGGSLKFESVFCSFGDLLSVTVRPEKITPTVTKCEVCKAFLVAKRSTKRTCSVKCRKALERIRAGSLPLRQGGRGRRQSLPAPLV